MRVSKDIIWHIVDMQGEKTAFILNCKNNVVMQLDNDAVELFEEILNNKEIDEEYYQLFVRSGICDDQ